MRRALLTATSLLFAIISVQAQDADSEEQAALAAEEWIVQIDTAAYAESWRSASGLVHEGVTEEQWVSAVDQVRSQVGSLSERQLLNSQYRTSLPNAPEGEYVVLQYATSFELIPQAMELIVMTKTDDGSWKAAGYQVAPAQQEGNQ